jgi:adenosylmethionine-8-amino-7-oxononanoate aminotransferase
MDRDTKQTFSPDVKLNQRIKAEAMARGVVVYPMPGTIDGVNGDHIVLAPPYIASDAEIDQIIDVVAQAIPAAVSGIIASDS